MHEGMKTQPMCQLLTPLLGQSIHFITGNQMLVQLIGFIEGICFSFRVDQYLDSMS